MVEMSRIERMTAVLEGGRPDRAPVSFWYHFPPEVAFGDAAVDAHLRHLQDYDLDFLKIMNDHPAPWQAAVHRAADLRNLPLLAGDEGGFGDQLALIRRLAGELSGRVLLTATVFNAWAVLRRVVVPRTSDKHNPPQLHGELTPVDARMHELLAEDCAAVVAALDVIAQSLANFARRCIEAGADGVYLSVRDDWVDRGAEGASRYDELLRPGDRKILEGAVQGRLNVLHACGVPRDFDAFASYPVAIINWADRAAGPAIREVIGRIKPTVCCGVDNLSTLPHGSPDDVLREVNDALDQAGDHPMIVSAGCTFAPEAVSSDNLHAMVAAAKAYEPPSD